MSREAPVRAMIQRQWLKPSECARMMGHRDPGSVIAAIRRGELPARQKSLTGTRVRYLVHAKDFARWFDQTWRPTSAA